jgi:hypothetical protein
MISRTSSTPDLSPRFVIHAPEVGALSEQSAPVPDVWVSGILPKKTGKIPDEPE